MKRFILIFLLASSTPVSAQYYELPGYVLEAITDHAEYSELFDNKDSFTVTQYLLYRDSDTLQLAGGCHFSFYTDKIIKACGFKKRPSRCKKSYWKWLEDEDGNKYGSYWECDKKGRLKRSPYRSFTAREWVITDTDSIVNGVTWWISDKGDTTCDFIYKWIYRDGKLVEHWSGKVYGGNCSWDTSYSLTKYEYPSDNVTVVQHCTQKTDSLECSTPYSVLKTYDSTGRLVSKKFTSSQHGIAERRYFYENGKWKWTEHWIDGVLVEKVVKTIP